MTVLRTPAALRAATASFASGFTSSEMTMWPRYTPSEATWTVVPTRWQGCQDTPMSSISLSLPAQMVWPSTTAFTPRPATSSTLDTREESISRP